MASNADIYEYQFGALFQRVKNLIGGETIKVYNNDEEEAIDKEVDDFIGYSTLLFDVSGKDFRSIKAADAEYRYWVEVYVLKAIENVMARRRIQFEEKYHFGQKEQHSIICRLNGKQIEAYFLYDIMYEEANSTDYDKIASVLKSNSQEVDGITIFIFRDCINYGSLAELINSNSEMNENGFVSVSPLKEFFDAMFGEGEYAEFFTFANAFQEKCNTIISYKTVITPTPKTIEAFKAKKAIMLKEMDYKRIASKGQSGELSEEEFEKVKRSFLTQKMYLAMVSNNDFADSFISAEWSYDVFSNAMGDLELTGIIAGYLKSIEQLLFAIVRFHKDQGFEIKTRYSGKQPYTSDNEANIDSTIGSLNSFVTSKEAKLALTAKIRGCIYKATDLWRQYQRNGYFHKDNLYASDNRIGEVRDLTIYLYFLILGGIRFSSIEKAVLGVFEQNENDAPNEFSEETVYPAFEKWLNNTFAYDLPEKIPGLWILLFNEENSWKVQMFLMTYFYIDEFESGDFEFSTEKIVESHTKDLPAFSWFSGDENYNNAHFNLIHLFDKYSETHQENMNRIGAIILGADKYTQKIHYKEQ